GAWRAVEYPSRVFARESFIDEIARAGGKDPLRLRIDLLRPGNILELGDQRIDRGRMIRVLEIARDKTGWTTPLSSTKDRLRGGTSAEFPTRRPGGARNRPAPAAMASRLRSRAAMLCCLPHWETTRRRMLRRGMSVTATALVASAALAAGGPADAPASGPSRA